MALSKEARSKMTQTLHAVPCGRRGRGSAGETFYSFIRIGRKETETPYEVRTLIFAS
jgi:hypothetical protein